MSYYPLKTGNTWTFKTNDGSTFTNTIVSDADGLFTMTNSTVAHETHVKNEGGTLFTDSYEAGKMQPFLKEDAVVGDNWEIKYKANGIDSVLAVVIKSIDGSREVEGKTYTDVMEMEGGMSFIVNGNVFPAGTKYQWYYAKGTGLILTTSTLGDNMPLVSFTVQ